MNWDDTTDTPAPERLVGASADREDQAVEAALRPKDLDEFIGQEKVREQLDLVLRAARARGATADHVLLSGAPGLGKTTLSMIIAAEMGAPIRITSGPAIQHAGDLAAI
ncbi:MAG: AAA family ATPase, partial [Streptomyces sp.]|nr:AAA family ATPase [Streptomyces sp.]